MLNRSRRALQRAIAQQLWDRHRPWRYLGTHWIQVAFRLKGDTAISLDVDLESELLEDSYGAVGSHVTALDARYAAPIRTKTRG